jgi:hypothetical protein
VQTLSAAALAISTAILIACRRDAPRETQAANLAQSLIGTWRPVEFARMSGTGRLFPFGTPPRGYLIYDNTGHVVFEVVRPGVPRPMAKGGGSPADAAELQRYLESFSGFFGTYQVNEAAKTVTHRLEGELPQTGGFVEVSEVAKPFDVRGDSLVFGRDSSTRWVFLRIRPTFVGSSTRPRR